MRRLALLLLAAAALLTAWFAARVSWADTAYRGALDAGDTPVRDVPGRIEAFETAVRRRPEDFTYRLRSGQLRLLRASTASSAADELPRALEHLRAAVASQPLDPRGRVSLARALGMEGDAEGLVRETSRAVVLGRHHTSVLLEATTLYVAEWRRTGIQSLLTLALEVEAERRAWSVRVAPRAAGLRLASRGDDAVGDVIMAAQGRPDLLRAGAALLLRADPKAAEVLLEQADLMSRVPR